MTKLTISPAWKNLALHREEISNLKSQPNEPLFSLSTDALSMDCFYQKATLQTKQYLIELAKQACLPERIEDLFQGKPLNISEKRAALHTALRDTENLRPEIKNCLDRMRQMSEKIRSKSWIGYTGKPIQSILHIGIGGSDLSQRLTVSALKKYRDSDIDIHFVANIDPEEIDDTLLDLNPETTLVIVASKSFSTKETQMNFEKAMKWLSHPEAISCQVIAVTACAEKALHYNLSSENILPIWDWVGGRYSIWSAMGFVLMIAIGYEHFIQFLKGAHAMDDHFRATPFENNIPVMLALMGIWSINFFHCQTKAIIPYSHQLTHLLAHLQQLEMESNGKSKTILGEQVDYATGSILWGGVGCNSQHSFHQLLHQGTHLLPIDFITIENNDNFSSHWLRVNCLAQIQAILKNSQSFIHLINLKALTPYTLGSLMALYEHKVFVQSQVWQINPFDQPGVELGKGLAHKVLEYLPFTD